MPPQNTQNPASSRRHTALSTEAQSSIAWQGRAAAAVVALTEVLYGASPAWQPAQAQISGSPTSSDDSRRRHNGARTCSTKATGGKTCSTTASGNRICSTTAAGDEAVGGAGQEGSRNGEEAGHHGNEPASDVGASLHGDGALEQLVVQVLGDFSNADVWQLPTHVEPDASPGGTTLTPQVSMISICLLCAVSQNPDKLCRLFGPARWPEHQKPPFGSRPPIMLDLCVWQVHQFDIQTISKPIRSEQIVNISISPYSAWSVVSSHSINAMLVWICQSH